MKIEKIYVSDFGPINDTVSPISFNIEQDRQR